MPPVAITFTGEPCFSLHSAEPYRPPSPTYPYRIPDCMLSTVDLPIARFGIVNSRGQLRGPGKERVGRNLNAQ